MKNRLSPAQTKLIEQLGADVNHGLTSDEAAARREQHGYHMIRPPLQCPSWVCCLLPCIKYIPSMKAFAQIQPHDAEVLRNRQWVSYEASSLVKGDVVRLQAGDLVPADCTVLQVLEEGELLVDQRMVTGDDKPVATMKNAPLQLFAGAIVTQGSAVAVVTAIGESCLVSSLIRDGRFPPKGPILQLEPMAAAVAGGGYRDTHDDNDSDGISLIQRTEPVV